MMNAPFKTKINRYCQEPYQRRHVDICTCLYLPYVIYIFIDIYYLLQVSAEETMKELTLQKEDTTMKKVIAQMMLMKQIQVGSTLFEAKQDQNVSSELNIFIV